MQKNQKGMSAVSMVLLLAVIVTVVLLAIRIVPVYTEYRVISRVVKYAAEGTSESDIRARYNQQIGFEGMPNSQLKGKDLQITFRGTAATVSFKYERELALVGDSVLLVFRMAGTEEGKNY